MTKCRKSFSGFFGLIVGIVFMIGHAVPAFAVKVVDVSGTRHNLSVSGLATANFWSTNEEEVCIFCHTPHNAGSVQPLWNNYSTTGNFTIYSSATIEYNPNQFAGGLDVNSSSRLCLSCHEGTVGINSLVNPGRSDANPLMGGGGELINITPAGVGTHISSDLTRMHPVGIDYLLSETPNDLDIKAIGIPEGKGLIFSPGPSGEKFLECSTCHDPHVNGESTTGGDPAYAKFLRIPNTSSAMCLACHDK